MQSTAASRRKSHSFIHFRARPVEIHSNTIWVLTHSYRRGISLYAHSFHSNYPAARPGGASHFSFFPATPAFSINSELLMHTFPASPVSTSTYELGTGGGVSPVLLCGPSHDHDGGKLLPASQHSVIDRADRTIARSNECTSENRPHQPLHRAQIKSRQPHRDRHNRRACNRQPHHRRTRRSSMRLRQ